MPKNQLIVLAAHIPLLVYADQGSSKHQVAQVKEVYEILEGRCSDFRNQHWCTGIPSRGHSSRMP